MYVRSLKELVVAASLLVVPVALPLSAGQDQAKPDNTKVNESAAPTADNQKMNTTDRELSRKIRRAVVQDKGLSTYAHNVKIIAQNGKVTLKGPVRSEDEKHSVEAKAFEIAGKENVNNELSVTGDADRSKK